MFWDKFWKILNFDFQLKKNPQTHPSNFQIEAIIKKMAFQPSTDVIHRTFYIYVL